MLPSFSLVRPESVGEALSSLDEDTVAYCGGTELLLAMKLGLLRPAGLVDLKRVDELRAIRVDADQLVIGATATHTEIARSELVGHHLPLLAEVEQRVGNARVRAQGTIGGNLCFAEPRSDLSTALIACGASVTLVSAAGRRSLPIQEFVLGAYWTAREPNELLVDITVPLPVERGSYVKFQTTERPTVGVAVVPDGAGGRIVVGAVADIPYVVAVDDLASVDVAGIADAVEPTADLTGSVRYKRHITSTMIGRALAALPGAAANGRQHA